MTTESLQRLTAVEAARRLLGCNLIRTFNDGSIAKVRIVETEAYDQTDAASHSFNGRTQRNNIMFGPSGYLYVYFTYGMHYCMNVVVGTEGRGAAVLIRAAEPIMGEELLHNHRKKAGINLTNGPAKLCQALNIDKGMNGHYLEQEPLKLSFRPHTKTTEIVVSKRIGIRKAVDKPWRFYIKGNRYVSNT